MTVPLKIAPEAQSYPNPQGSRKRCCNLQKILCFYSHERTKVKAKLQEITQVPLKHMKFACVTWKIS